MTKTNTKFKIGPIINQNGGLVTNDKAKANVLNNFFVSSGQELSEKFTQETEDKNSYVYIVAPSTDMLVLNEEGLELSSRK